MMLRNRLWRVGAALALTSTFFLACNDDDDDVVTPPPTGGAAGAATGGAPAGGTGGVVPTGGDAGNGGLGGNGGAVGGEDLVDTLAATGNHETLIALLTLAELNETLRNNGPYTLFAPTDDAFETFEDDNPGVLDDLTPEQLSNVLRYHVVEERFTSQDLEDEQELETLADGNPTITVNLNDEVTLTDGNVLTDDATVTEADIEASNGVIHSIDGIMLPPDP